MNIEDTEEFIELKKSIPAEKMDDFMAAFNKAKSELSTEELDAISGGRLSVRPFKKWWKEFKEEWWKN